jgi:hypothetical protein
MKKTTCLILTAFVAGCQLLAAQNNRNDTIARRNVVIERDYVPTVKNVEKLEIAPVITEPQLTKSEVNYSEKLFPQTPEYELNKWPAAAIHINQNSYKKGYALLGVGLYGTALGDLFYPIVDETTQRLTFDAHVHGLFGNTQRQWITNFGLDYLKRLALFDLNIGAYFKRNGFNYYGTNTSYHDTANGSYKDSTNNMINFGLKAGIRSKNVDQEAIAYQGDIGYNNLTPGKGLGEQQIRLKGNVDVPLGEHRLGIDIDNYNFFYTSYQGNSFPNHSIVGLNSYFGMKGDNWKIRLGVKEYFSINGKGNSSNLMPDVTAQIDLTKTVTFYGGITGQYNVNSMQQITNENPYIYPGLRVEDSYAPIDLYGGIKFSPLSGLLINGSVDYTHYNKQYFYINGYYFYGNIITTSPSLLPVFYALYDKADVVITKINASYNWKDKILAHFNARYNSWDTKTLDKAWMRPSTEIETGAEAKISRNVFVNANYCFAGGRYAYVAEVGAVKMKNTNDLSIGASYSYSDWLTAFVRVNNLLGTKSQTFYGYDSLGINWQIGAAFSF